MADDPFKPRSLHIAVIGGSAQDSDPESYDQAEEVGRQVAKRGCVLVNGGGTGTMVSSAKGAIREQGTTIGILPGGSRTEANPYINHAIPTGLGHLRNTIVIHSSDAVVALPGSWGTLSEIALARVWAKPVVALPFWMPFFGDQGAAMGFDGVHIADDATSAVDKAIALAKSQIPLFGGRL